MFPQAWGVPLSSMAILSTSSILGASFPTPESSPTSPKRQAHESPTLHVKALVPHWVSLSSQLHQQDGHPGPGHDIALNSTQPTYPWAFPLSDECACLTGLKVRDWGQYLALPLTNWDTLSKPF